MTEQPERSSSRSTDDVAVEELAGALADPVTRRAAAYLTGTERASLPELADAVTGWMNADSGEIASRTDWDRTRIHLYHVALPRLAAVGVVEFDPSAKTARVVAGGDTVRAVLEWYESRGLVPTADRRG